MELFNSRRSILDQLSETYRTAPRRRVAPDERFIIFSDHHRGDRGPSDFFQQSEKTYHAALGYYLERGHTLVLLGDVEEFWECRPSRVMESYRLTCEIEREFHVRGRLVKIRGNHDNLWKKSAAVERYLGELFPGIEVLDGLRLQRVDDEGGLIEFFLAHGHQGSFLSDHLDWFGRFWLRLLGQWSVVPFKQRYMTPAVNYSLREEHEGVLFDWADEQNRQASHPVLFVAGHTHHPIFMNHDLVERMLRSIEALKKTGTKRNLKRAAVLRAALEYSRADLGPNRQMGRAQSCFFNTGCCCFKDGSITGMEITRKKIRLVRWWDAANRAERMILGSLKLRDLTRSSTPRVEPGLDARLNSPPEPSAAAGT